MVITRGFVEHYKDVFKLVSWKLNSINSKTFAIFIIFLKFKIL